jgi:hypothetical protein
LEILQHLPQLNGLSEQALLILKPFRAGSDSAPVCAFAGVSQPSRIGRAKPQNGDFLVGFA